MQDLAPYRALAIDGGMTVGDLSAHLRVDMSVASRQVSSATEADLVERTTCDGPGCDRRVRTVRLTTISARRRSRARPPR